MSPDKAEGASAAAQRLRRQIRQGGPVPVSLFMALANAHYYATRDPLGAAGDFITAPEISQMFGELIGLWCADIWMRAASPASAAWVELGPGRGTLAGDALRSMRRFGLEPEVHLVETSPVLRDLQAAAVPGAQFHADVSTLPHDRPLIVVANEFFDALPFRQLVMTGGGWRERLVALSGDSFVPAVGDVPMDAALPAHLRAAAPGDILETSPAGAAVARDIAASVARQGGVLLVIDYGYERAAHGDSLQALSGHAYADPFERVGECDLTAHVDFGALAAVGTAEGLTVAGPVGQGAFLRALGLDARAEALARSRPERRDDIMAARDRLSEPVQMGELFKALAMTAPGWPAPEGFA